MWSNFFIMCCRCELPRTPSDQMLNAAVESAGPPRLSAWEMWLVNKAKEERLKLEMKSEKASHSQLSFVYLQLFKSSHISCFCSLIHSFLTSSCNHAFLLLSVCVEHLTSFYLGAYS